MNRMEEFEMLNRELEQTPPELEFTVARAKARAKSRKRLKWAGVPVGALAGVLVILCVLGATRPTVAMALEPIPVIGPLIRAVSAWNYQYGAQAAQVQIPQTEHSALNEQVEKYTAQIISSFLKDVGKEDDSEYRMSLEYQELKSTEGLFVLKFDHVVEMAGTNNEVKIYNLDLRTGRILALKDLFEEKSDYLGALSDEIIRQMEERMAEDSGQEFFIGKQYKAWEFKQLSEDADFYLNEAGNLVIVFDKYEVAPGSMGIVQFEIHRDTISGILLYGY